MQSTVLWSLCFILTVCRPSFFVCWSCNQLSSCLSVFFVYFVRQSVGRLSLSVNLHCLVFITTYLNAFVCLLFSIGVFSFSLLSLLLSFVCLFVCFSNSYLLFCRFCLSYCCLSVYSYLFAPVVFVPKCLLPH